MYYRAKNKHGTVTKTNVLINGTKLKTQTQIYIFLDTCFFIRNLEKDTKKASLTKFTDQTKKNPSRSILITLYQSILQMDERSAILNLVEEKIKNNLELIGIGKDFLNRTTLVQALRTTINK